MRKYGDHKPFWKGVKVFQQSQVGLDLIASLYDQTA